MGKKNSGSLIRRISPAEVSGAAIILLTALSGLLLRPVAWGQDLEANEYQIKAAYLLNFPNFVDWPGSASNDSQSPLRLCLVGSDPLGSALSRMMADRLSRGRALLLRRVSRTEPFSDCQILYISPSESKYLPQILESVHNVSALTVGETDRFVEEGGMIQLVMEDNRIRFKINPSAASEAGIRISSKLLALAKIVTPAHSTPSAGPRHQVTLKEQSFKGASSANRYCWRIEHTGLINVPMVA